MAVHPSEECSASCKIEIKFVQKCMFHYQMAEWSTLIATEYYCINVSTSINGGIVWIGQPKINVQAEQKPSDLPHYFYSKARCYKLIIRLIISIINYVEGFW